jgi:ABC-type bacteriocin/lantibiotic exporter with double-glycine peptidase domain
MILAHHAIEVSEDELVRGAAMDEGGVDIEELARLARRFGVHAGIQQLSLEDIADFLAQDRWAIVFLNRLPLDQVFSVHAVIPVRVTAHFVTILDPRLGERRLARHKLEAARRYLSFYGVICGPLV